MSPSKIPYSHILAISSIQDNLKKDKETVKPLEPESITLLDSGFDAIDYITENPVDLVLCDTHLGDMEGVRFLHLMRKNIRRYELPIIMISDKSDEEYVLDIAREGCTDYVLRPYDPEFLRERITQIKENPNYKRLKRIEMDEAKKMLDAGEFDRAINIFRKVTNKEDEMAAKDYYKRGREHLKQRRFTEAAMEFQKAIAIYDVFGEAYEGVALAYQGKRDTNNHLNFLKKALIRYALSENLMKSKSLYFEILRTEKNFANPFNALGIERHEKGQFPEAIRYFKHALELTPGDENVQFNTARCYHSMSEIDKAKVHLGHALTINPDFSEAQSFFEQISGRKP